MAVGIVDRLEVIDIENHDAEGRALALGTGELAAEHIVDRRAVEQFSERVVGGSILQTLASFEEIVLKLKDPKADAEARAKLSGVDRLGEVIVGA